MLGMGALWAGEGKGAGDTVTVTWNANVTGDWQAMAVRIPRPAMIHQVYVQAQSLTGVKMIITDLDTLGKSWDVNTQTCSDAVVDIEGSFVFTCNILGSHATLLRHRSSGPLWVEKFVVAGSFCDESVLIVTNQKQTTVCAELTFPDQVVELPGPVMIEGCVQYYLNDFPDYYDGYTLEFYEPDWTKQTDLVTYDAHTDKLIVMATAPYFDMVYPDQPAE